MPKLAVAPQQELPFTPDEWETLAEQCLRMLKGPRRISCAKQERLDSKGPAMCILT